MARISADAKYVYELVRDRLGMDYEYRFEQLEARLRSRYQELGCRDLADYARLLRSTDAKRDELLALSSVVANNETYFFRERPQIEALVGPIIDELRATPNEHRPLRILSAACSSGEEPYSLAIALFDSLKLGEGEFSILGIDMSERALTQARLGTYPSSSFQTIDADLLHTYFHSQSAGMTVNDQLKKHVRFANINLLETKTIADLGTFDVIFCRNVLMYFNRATQRHVLANLTKILQNDGYLVLGHADSIREAPDSFSSMTLRGGIVHKRMATGASPQIRTPFFNRGI